MCNLWKQGEKTKELTLDQVGAVADIFARLGVINVSVGGAEPFARRDLPDLVATLKRRGLAVRVLTNGVLPTREAIEKVANAGLDEVSVSLDTLWPEKQAYICDREGAWSRAVETICSFSELLPKRGRVLLINTVVSHLNAAELPALAEFAGKLGYFISFVPVHLAESDGASDLFAAYAPQMATAGREPEVLQRSYDRLLAMKRSGARIVNSSEFLRKSQRFLSEGRADWRCDAGRLYFSIDPTGAFSICHKFEKKHAYAFDAFMDHFDAREFEAERQKLVASCGGCMRPCWGEVSHLIHYRESFIEMLRIRLAVRRPRRSVSLEQALGYADELRVKCEDTSYQPPN